MDDVGLDNPFFSALDSIHRDVALRRGDVARYPADVAPFLGVAHADIDVGDNIGANLQALQAARATVGAYRSDLTQVSALMADDPATLRVADLTVARLEAGCSAPVGAFALNEWLRDGRVLLKTSRGARLTASPWNREEA